MVLWCLRINVLLNKDLLVTDRPGPPEGPTRIENTSKYSVDLTWNPPLDNGGSEITGYIIEKCDLTTNLWRRATTSTNTSVTISCLEEHKEYKFRILAENLVGISEPGPESQVAVTREATPENIDYDSLCKFSIHLT